MLVNEREFYIWRLEKWWVAFGATAFKPENRKHLFGSWYWRI